MNSKYKIMKYRGFNPFRPKESKQLNELMQKDAAKRQNLKRKSKLNMKQIALILNGHLSQSHEQKKQQKSFGSVVTENYELHHIKSPTENSNQRQRIVMFNDKQFCSKIFDYVYAQNELQQKRHQLYENILKLSSNKSSNQNSRLIFYLANSRQASQRLIHGHNQTQSFQQSSPSLLKSVYQRMISDKNSQDQKNPSNIYFSAIGIEKENSLHDLLNQLHIHNDESRNNVPQVRVRKVMRGHDSIIAENLKRELIKSEDHLDELIEKTQEVKNFIEFYEKFDQTFFLGELYHFYEANANYDLFNQCVILKINQHLPKLSSSTLIDGFYQRRLKQSNSSRIATFIMRIGLNIKACRKSKLNRQATLSFTNDLKLAQVEMHQSKILLYLGPMFMNLATQFVVANQMGTGESITEEIHKLQLNRGFGNQKNLNSNFNETDFYHTKHYLDLSQVKQIVKTHAIKYLVTDQNKKISLNLSNNLKSRTNHYSARKKEHPQILLQEQTNEQQNQLESMKGRKYSKSTTYRTFDPQRQKSLLHQGQKVRSKSFFSHTISSSQRNYWKSIDREINYIYKNSNLVDIGKLLYDNSDQTLNGVNGGKTINSKTEMMKVVEEKSLVRKSLDGVRVSYTRKMVVKQIQGSK